MTAVDVSPQMIERCLKRSIYHGSLVCAVGNEQPLALPSERLGSRTAPAGAFSCSLGDLLDKVSVFIERVM